ncbi:hypothetical protein LV89_04282 [Arcicella aurantiaca]|uniref:Uncharacterized protein n=2 Tax=Arcicella aurantiaca TaxID=591202 RepID=A0A316DIX5_9BACT|nr:hypothetical protein LV89_04282 [Arcicella aurantiaca]
MMSGVTPATETKNISMKADVYSDTNLIGTTNLQIIDESMGCLQGVFLPTDYYFEHIQKFVRKFWKTNKPHFDIWNSLRINIQLENGYFIFAQGGVTFDDSPNFPNEPLRIDVSGVDSHVIEDFFKVLPPKPFLQEPWTTISIEQKIAFEDELRKEIGSTSNQSSFFNFFKSKKQDHILIGFTTSALCKFQSNDDVLFVSRNPKIKSKFVVVHLTWKGNKESGTFPSIRFYESFEQFINLRMKVDIADWDE